MEKNAEKSQVDLERNLPSYFKHILSFRTWIEVRFKALEI